MGNITIVGLGPGAAGNLSLETMDLLKSEAQVILRTAVHPTVAELEKQNVQFTSCDSFYEEGANFEEVYGRVVARVLAAAMEGDVVYAVPGSPLVAGIKEARLVHGKGTGALRACVHDILIKDDRVESFRAGAQGEGDAGVTIVKFR